MTYQNESTIYRLIKPGKFQSTVIHSDVYENDLVVEPTLVSVCHADLRYYTGERRQDALADKLPMALFHEGIGIVQNIQNKNLNRVCIIPNIPGYIVNGISKENCCTPCRMKDSNYCENSIFLGSGYDGLAQSRIVLPRENIVPIPNDVPDEIAVLAELCSVSVHAIRNIDIKTMQSDKKIAIFGDGPVGFLTAAILHYLYLIPKERLYVFGVFNEKLDNFDFAKTININKVNFNELKGIHTIFECTGGHFSELAIDQAIECIERQGTIILLGVTEEKIKVNTRNILEKGIHLVVTSRSSREDFLFIMEAFKNKNFQNILYKISPNKPIKIRNISDLKLELDNIVANKGWRKTNLQFIW